MCCLKEIFSPNKRIDVVIDSDVYNESDDCFALAYLLGNTERFNLKGITVAPFAPIHNKKVKDIAEGIQKSNEAAREVLRLAHREDFKEIHDGGNSFLAKDAFPIESDAANFLIELSKSYDERNRLYVIAIGAITTIASALLKDESLKERIALVWLGGNAEFYKMPYEFNLCQDVRSAQVVFETDLPLMQVPCRGVVSAFTTGYYELEHFLKGKNPLCDYLFEKMTDTAKIFASDVPTWSRPVWDVVAVASLLNDNERYMDVEEKKRRTFDLETGKYGEETSLSMLQVEKVNRDVLMYDLFCTLHKVGGENQ